jgi:hypothetical protein
VTFVSSTNVEPSTPIEQQTFAEARSSSEAHRAFGAKRLGFHVRSPWINDNVAR